MKSILIDSHELIWMLFEPKRFQGSARQIILNADSVYVSIVSVWELTLKHNKGNLVYSPDQLIEGVKSLNASLLGVEPSHILALKNTKLLHKDPFDNMLVAQARTEGLYFLTADRAILGLNLDFTIDARK